MKPKTIERVDTTAAARRDGEGGYAHDNPSAFSAHVEPTSGLVATALTFEALVESNADFVFRCLRRAGLDVATAEDAAQQVFLVASKKLSSIVAGHEKGFLYATAKNVAAQQKRSAFRLREVEWSEESVGEEPRLADDGPSLDELLDQQRARALLDEVLASMPEKLRDVFVLSEIEELTAPEVSACLSIPLGTVASRLAKAREVFDATLGRMQKQRSFRGGRS